MSRLINAFASDIRYQWRYGFYLIYAILTICFIAVLRLVPESWRQTTLIMILLFDPSLLGFIFIGGILQLERGEGILDALFCSPMRPWEYLIAKTLSLALISLLVGCAVLLGSGMAGIHYIRLMISMLLGSACFTLIGISISINLRSMNAFLSINGLWEALLLTPPVLLIFNVPFALLEAFPASIALRLIQNSAGFHGPFLWYVFGMAVWTAGAFWLALKRLDGALHRLGGAS